MVKFLSLNKGRGIKSGLNFAAYLTLHKNLQRNGQTQSQLPLGRHCHQKENYLLNQETITKTKHLGGLGIKRSLCHNKALPGSLPKECGLSIRILLNTGWICLRKSIPIEKILRENPPLGSIFAKPRTFLIEGPVCLLETKSPLTRGMIIGLGGDSSMKPSKVLSI